MHALPPNIAEKRNSRLLTLSTKVSLADLSTVEEKASLAGLTKSTYLRLAAISGQVQPRAVIPQINQRQWLDLAKMAGNINQIATHLNGGGAIDANISVLLSENRRILAAVRESLIGQVAPHGLPN